MGSYSSTRGGGRAEVKTHLVPHFRAEDREPKAHKKVEGISQNKAKIVTRSFILAPLIIFSPSGSKSMRGDSV